MKVDMNDALRRAARAMEDGAYEDAAAAFLQIMNEQPEHAALCASQIGAANYFLGRYGQAIEWYRKAGELGFDAAMVETDIAEAEEASRRAGAGEGTASTVTPTATAADRAAAVRSALAAVRSKKILVAPLPDKKERNVRAELPPALRGVEILGLVDLTVFGSAKNAIVFTPEHLLYVDAEKSWQVAWTELVGLDGFTNFSQDTIGLRLASETRKLYAGTGARDVLEVLEAIQRDARAVTTGGSTIMRHAARAAAPAEVAHADDERLVAHLERWLGGESMVWHEIVSERIHLDVHMFAATPERPFRVLVTSGVSALPMALPPAARDDGLPDRIELCILLPADWPMEQSAFRDERHYWPVRLLKSLGRIPHEFDTWLGVGHSIPNGDPAEPYAKGVPYTGAVLVPPPLFPDEALVVDGSPPIALLQVIPLTTREMAIKLDQGTEALFERLERECEERLGPVSRSPRTLR